MNLLPSKIEARNVNHALPVAVMIFNTPDRVRRIAPRDPEKVTLEVTGPMVTVFTKPFERVLFSVERDANPFFHFLEALWILSGSEDVEWLANVLPSIAEFSDDGKTFHGAYGARLRNVIVPAVRNPVPLRKDQLEDCIALLRKDPDTRRAVCALWQPVHDSGYNGKDMPCNTMLTFKLREGRLHLTVFNRSNDMVWGAYGANVVQFSSILEYMCGMLDVRPGHMCTWSDSFHVYEKNAAWQRCSKIALHVSDPYDVAHLPIGQMRSVEPYPMVADAMAFDGNLLNFMGYSEDCFKSHEKVLAFRDCKNPYFDFVARPMFNAFISHKRKQRDAALAWAHEIAAADWKLAALEWLHRRYGTNVIQSETTA